MHFRKDMERMIIAGIILCLIGVLTIIAGIITGAVFLVQWLMS